MDSFADLALRERKACDVSDALPRPRYPFYSTTLECTIESGESSCTLEFEAERDTTFTDMTVDVTETDTPGTQVAALVDIEYCNVHYYEHVDAGEFGACCARKPIVLIGVKEDKKLKITVTLTTAADEDNTVLVTLTGFQGNGCCP